MLNIYSQYETSQTAEEQGVWVEISEGAEVLIARLNNPAHRKAMDTYRKPYKDKIRLGTLSDEEALMIAVKSLAAGVLLGWKGIAGRDGQPLEYSKQAAESILKELKDFRDLVVMIAGNAETYRREALEESAKNSQPPSAGSAKAAATKNISD